jgi:hypothetical protein
MGCLPHTRESDTAVRYPTTKGIQRVLDEMISRDTKAKNSSAGQLYRCSILKELEQSGFIQKSLWD